MVNVDVVALLVNVRVQLRTVRRGSDSKSLDYERLPRLVLVANTTPT